MNTMTCITDCLGGGGGIAAILAIAAPTIINGFLKSHQLPGWAGAVLDVLAVSTRRDSGGTWKRLGRRSGAPPAPTDAPPSTDTPPESPAVQP